jgi:hypothetical protein
MGKCTRALWLLLLASGISRGYSVLGHEAVIDSAWKDSIRPLLMQRFPQATPDELLRAHAYAYGGCIIQDMGYYPFGNRFFSDLVHYVRSGDFVVELIRQSQDVNEYAFALGALAHYSADSMGHPLGVNPSVGLLYPNLRRKFGPLVTYEDNPAAHIKVEFSFDVLEVAGGHYAPTAYHDFIGFEVSERLLESSFRTVYGLELGEVFRSLDLSIGTYRFSVRTFIPEATKVAWTLEKDQIRHAQPSMTRARFLYNLSRSGYRREWGTAYRRPGVLARFLAFLFRIFPKVGPFRAFSFRPPTQATEKLFMASFNATLKRYRALLADTGAGRLQLENLDLDTGNPTQPVEYRLADDAYSKLARTLAEKHFAATTPPLKKDILSFFADPARPIATRRNKRAWRDTLRALEELGKDAQRGSSGNEKTGSISTGSSEAPLSAPSSSGGSARYSASQCSARSASPVASISSSSFARCATEPGMRAMSIR